MGKWKSVDRFFFFFSFLRAVEIKEDEKLLTENEKKIIELVKKEREKEIDFIRVKEYVKPIEFPYKKVVKVYEKPIGILFFFLKFSILSIDRSIGVSRVMLEVFREARLTWNFHVIEETTIKYQLSNPLFVKLGWTMLPVSKVMRKVIEYQTTPAKPHLDWYGWNIVLCYFEIESRLISSSFLLLYIFARELINVLMNIETMIYYEEQFYAFLPD